MRLRLPSDKKYKPHGNAFVPEQWQHDMAMKLGAILPPDQIATILEISIPTLYKFFKADMDLGRAQTHAVLGQMAIYKAIRGNEDMLKFVLSRKFAWHEPKNEIAKAVEDALNTKTEEALKQELYEILERKRIALQESVANEDVEGQAAAD